MLDRYDPRDDEPRDRGDSRERDWGSRGGGERANGLGDEGGVYARHVDLPRGPEREIVRERKRSYELNGREGDALATIAAFRVVQVRDVQEMLDDGRGGRSAQKGLDHLLASGLLERIPLERRDDDVVALTDRGRNLLEANRCEHAGEPRQAFYAGLRKPRELTHDVQEILGQERGEQSVQKSLDHLQASGLLERIPLERRDKRRRGAKGPGSRPPRSESA